MALTIIDRKSERLNFIGRRAPSDIKLLVLHHTGGSTLSSAVSTLKERNLSYHYLIDVDGKIYQYVDELNNAQHAPPYNGTSIGISLVAERDDPGVFAYTKNGTPIQATRIVEVGSAQYNAAVELGRELQRRYNLPINAVVGHGEIDANKLPTEGAKVTNALRNGQPAPINLASLQGRSTVSGQSSGQVSSNYFDRTYLLPLRELRDKGGNSGASAGDVIQNINKITVGNTGTSLQQFVESNSITNVRGEIAVLSAVVEANVQAQRETRSVVTRVDGLLPAEAGFVVQYDLFEFFPDKMRQKMSINSGGGTNPNYSHAWRSPGKLAVTANITIPGASGFRIGQIFWIGRTYEHYKKYGAFQLFGLTETIDVSRGWTTELYARFNAIPESKVATLKPSV